MTRFLVSFAAVSTLACAPKGPAPATDPGPVSRTGPRELVNRKDPSTLADTLQRAAATALRESGHAGAVVVMSVGDGSVLASAERLGRLSKGIHARARPGSAIKPLLVLSALSEGVLKPGEQVHCPGHFGAGKDALTCFASHGPQDPRTALATSCNVFAYEVASRLGTQRLAHHFGEFGIELDEEMVKSQRAAVLGTGHGEILVSPVQLASAYTKVARAIGGGGEAYSEAALTEVSDGMRRVVASDVGTGRKAAVSGLDVLGKTGTVQVGESMDGWMVAMAPGDAPEVVVVVRMEDVRTGGADAAPVAGQVLAEFARARAQIPVSETNTGLGDPKTGKLTSAKSRTA